MEPTGRPAKTLNENRKFPRFEADRFVKFAKADAPAVLSFSQVINVSGDGLLITSREPLSSRSVLQLQFPATHDQRPLTLKAQVMWCRELPRAEGSYYLGMRFMDVPEPDREVALRAISKEFIITRE